MAAEAVGDAGEDEEGVDAGEAEDGTTVVVHGALMTITILRHKRQHLNCSVWSNTAYQLNGLIYTVRSKLAECVDIE